MKYELNSESQTVIELFLEGENLFVTGEAGTGKTTLLKELLKRNEEVSNKKIVILAPTGVAAENVKGMTMHHFLKLPMKPYLPDHKVMPSLYKLEQETIDVICNLDVIIIDEISMVRCDMLDAMDMILRHYRKNKQPFGGVQIIMFGDLFQLAPVVKNTEWVEMKEYYDSVYFFSSRVLEKLNYKVVELTKIYRQRDNNFINILNDVRVADINKKELERLNCRYEKNFKTDVMDDIVTLMTHNKKANRWNRNMLLSLKNKSYEYVASVNNWYNKHDYPAELKLVLKKGARVMLIRNTDSYKNGTMGRIEYLDPQKILVRKDDGCVIKVDKAKWELLEYKVDKKKKIIHTKVVGTFTQYPLRLAWAVSIHKSQGLTFDEVAIDASKSFAFGQIYVALSRCRTFEGIHLLSKITSDRILADDIVKSYLRSKDIKVCVKQPGKLESVQYEDFPLVLRISRKVFEKIRDCEKDEYRHSIDLDNKELLLQHKNGKICVNNKFSNKKKNWNYRDINNGCFPFVQRHYKKVIFKCISIDEKIEAKINGLIKIYLNKDNYWAFKFSIDEKRKVCPI